MVGMRVSGVAISLAVIPTELVDPEYSTGFGAASNVQTIGRVGYRLLPLAAVMPESRKSSNFLCSDYRTDWTTLMYFAIGVSLTAAGLVSYGLLEKLPYSAYHMKHGEGSQ